MTKSHVALSVIPKAAVLRWHLPHHRKLASSEPRVLQKRSCVPANAKLARANRPWNKRRSLTQPVCSGETVRLEQKSGKLSVEVVRKLTTVKLSSCKGSMSPSCHRNWFFFAQILDSILPTTFRPCFLSRPSTAIPKLSTAFDAC